MTGGVALIAGFFLYADPRRRRALAPAHAWAGPSLGLGGFYGVDITPYDCAWNVPGPMLLLVGTGLAAHAVPARSLHPGG